MAEVELYDSPYVAGQRAAAYYPPVICSIFLADESVTSREDEWDDALERLLELVKQKTLDAGGNAFVGMMISMDPFAIDDGEPGLRLIADGCPVTLEPMF